jgi:hypothetical protein
MPCAGLITDTYTLGPCFPVTEAQSTLTSLITTRHLPGYVNKHIHRTLELVPSRHQLKCPSELPEN